jgi:hypothetical protein
LRHPRPRYSLVSFLKIEEKEDVVKREKSPLPPQFFLPDLGESLHGLRKAHVEAMASRLGITLKPRFPLKPTQPNSIAVGPMKPPQGPTPVGQLQAHQTKTQKGGFLC